jgi:hypothetical protein
MPNRREFVSLAAIAGAAALLHAQAQQPSPPAQNSAPLKPPALDTALVKEYVIAGHGELDKVKQMLGQEPGLLNSTWDWGGGDFEIAIGGAGHMGRADIANYIISQGGRFDIFVAAMLGKVEIVKNYLTLYPNLAQSKGPHGLTLMYHAKKGGEAASDVVKYLESLK